MVKSFSKPSARQLWVRLGGWRLCLQRVKRDHTRGRGHNMQLETAENLCPAAGRQHRRVLLEEESRKCVARQVEPALQSAGANPADDAEELTRGEVKGGRDLRARLWG